MAWMKKKPRRAPAPGPAAGGARGDGVLEASPAQIIEALKEACHYRQPTVVICSQNLAVFRGRFRDLDDDALLIELDFEGEDPPFKPTSYCFVSYAHQTRIGVFIAMVIRTRVREDGTHLVLEPPKQVCAVEARKTFRVPVPASAKLRLAGRTADGKVWALKARDMSLNGALVEFPGDDPLPIEINKGMDVRIALGKIDLTVYAVVKRIVGRQCGLFFPENVEGGRVIPTEELLALLQALERIWLKQKRLEEGKS